MVIYRLIMLTLITVLAPHGVLGQKKSETERYRLSTEDTARLEKNRWRVEQVRPTEKFDIVFNRGFEIFQPSGVVVDTLGGGTGGSEPSDIRINHAASGTYFLGFSFNFLLSPRFALKVQPGYSIYNVTLETDLFFEDLDTTINPSVSVFQSTFTSQYIEVPVGLSYVLYREPEKKRLVTFLEAGLTAGLKLGSAYKERINDDQGNVKVEITYPGVDEISNWRFGVYAKAVYRFVGVWAYYRLNPFLNPTDANPDLPELGRLEIGFSIVL